MIINIVYIIHMVNIYQQSNLINKKNIPLFLTLLLIFPMLGIFINFLGFHVRLVMKNITTIENLERLRDFPDNEEESLYDIGVKYNWK